MGLALAAYSILRAVNSEQQRLILMPTFTD